MGNLKKSIEKALNNQISMEAYASHFYLALAYWCDDQALDGCKNFFERQSEEERQHMLKFYEYLSECNCKPITPSLAKPIQDFKSIKNLFEQVLAQEKKVTASINKIMALAFKESDFATVHFLQWFIEEQREEEALIQSILDRIKIIGAGGQSLYYIDKEISNINAAELAKDSAE